MNDGIGLAEVLLGLPGFRVLDVAEADDEVVDLDRVDGGAGVLSDVWGARRAAGSDAGRRPRSGLLRAAGAAACGRSGGGVVASRCARHGRGPRPPSTSTRRRC